MISMLLKFLAVACLLMTSMMLDVHQARPVVKSATAATPGTDERPAQPSPEERMRARFPQPVKVRDLIGLPVLDAKDRTLGYVENVVRTPAGQIRLIVPYASWFGWARSIGAFSGYRKPVAVPIEVVAILGRHINAVDMDRPEFEKASAWTSKDEPVSQDETIRIALGKR